MVGGGGGSLVGGLLGVDSLSLVLDVSDVALGTGGVGDDLDTAVGKVDPVLSLGVVVGTVLLVGEDSSGVGGVVNSKSVLQDWRGVRCEGEKMFYS